MSLKEKYFLIVYGSFDKGHLEYDDYPDENEIINAINRLSGKSAIVEKRYVLEEQIDK